MAQIKRYRMISRISKRSISKTKCSSDALRKQDLRLLTGLLTGHVSLNRHLTIMKLRSDPLCPLCKEDSETSLHFLGSCVARMAIRRNIMGAPIMSSEALRQLRFSTLLRFAKASEIYITIPVNLGLRIGPELWSPRWVKTSSMESSTPKKR